MINAAVISGSSRNAHFVNTVSSGALMRFVPVLARAGIDDQWYAQLNGGQ
jgi:hypothetical protein